MSKITMSRFNQNNEPVQEDVLFSSSGSSWEPATPEECREAIALICGHLNVSIVRTNATKRGNVEIVLRESME